MTPPLAANRNECLFEHPASVRARIEKGASLADFTHYAPKGVLESVRRKMAQAIGVQSSALKLCHGAEDALFRALAAARGFGATQVALPSWGWENYYRLADGVHLQKSPYPIRREGSSFQTDLEALSSLLDSWSQHQLRGVVVLNSPANPTGHRIPVAQLDAFFGRHPQHMFVLDAVYDNPNSGVFALGVTHSHVAVAGGWSKFFGLPGLRLGCVVGQWLPEIAESHMGFHAFQLALGEEALGEWDWYESVHTNMVAFGAMAPTLSNPALEFFRSESRALLARVPFPTASAPVQPSSDGLAHVVCGTEPSLEPWFESCSLLAGLRPKPFLWEGHQWFRFSLGDAAIEAAIAKWARLFQESSFKASSGN